MANRSARTTAPDRHPGAARAVAVPPAPETLYIVWHEGVEMGIGTAREIRDLIAEGALPARVDLVAVSRRKAKPRSDRRRR